MKDNIVIVKKIKEQVKKISTQILNIDSLAEIEKAVSEKGKSNYVTKYDLEVENQLKQNLKNLIPNSTFLGEETGGKISETGYTWVVDPIDGTTNFIHGLPFAISIGLIKNKETIIGCIYNPTTDDFWYAIKNNGAYKNEIKLQASNRNEISGTVMQFGFPYDINKTEDILKKVLDVKNAGAADIKRIGPACLDICRVASGECDAYFEHDLKPWDIAAAKLILEEAGGNICKMDGNKYDFSQSSIIACNQSKKLQMELLKILKK